MKTRTGQLYWLIGLTAVTMTPQYALQGWLATGHAPDAIPTWFWYADAAAWSIRAIIEAAALVYLFSTKATIEKDQRLLTGFEIALIALIVITLGPALYSVSEGGGITATMPWFLRLIWSFAVAAYAPLMLGAVGFAYKVQMAQSEPDEEPADNWLTELMSADDAKEQIAEPTQKSEPSKSKAKKSRPDPHKCQDCGKEFASVQALSAHGRWCKGVEQIQTSLNGNGRAK